MTQSAVAKWLEEIAAAKAKVKAKTEETTIEGVGPSAQRSLPLIESLTLSNNRTNNSNNSSSDNKNNGKKINLEYESGTEEETGLVVLLLPVEPRKPDPGECCGNDCEPCVNTVYWQDLAAYREKVKMLQEQQYRQRRQHQIELEEKEKEKEKTDASLQKEVQVQENEQVQKQKATRLNIRSYTPFKIVEKRYLSDNTLLVVCDAPALSSAGGNNEGEGKSKLEMSTFHVLIRFQVYTGSGSGDNGKHRDEGTAHPAQGQPSYVTKAFTPVDLHVANGKLAFLVKLYPSPHRTSDLFRALQVWHDGDKDVMIDCGSGGSGGSGILHKGTEGLLYLRGPILTTWATSPRSRLSQHEQVQQKHTSSAAADCFNGDNATSGGIVGGDEGQDQDIRQQKRRRIVMIAAGSGITPMYQILQQYHREVVTLLQHERRQEQEDQVHTLKQEQELQFDLIYCNRSRSDIWLRQELQEMSIPLSSLSLSSSSSSSSQIDDAMEGYGARTRTRTKTRIVRVQHILSAMEKDSDAKEWNDPPESPPIYGQRLTVEILDKVLQQARPVMTTTTTTTTTLSRKENLHIVICGPPTFNRD
ncbi:hypothetical protein BGZ94_002733, partial [Podila epigama]